MKKTDAQLLRAARGAATPFRELYERYAERIHGYHLRRSRDRDAAHDLTAETFARAWLLRSRFRDDMDGAAGPWLFGIARNVLLEAVRRGQLASRRVAFALVAVVFAVPAAAIGAAQLIRGHEVAESMPAGAAIFAGRDATCSAVVPNVEYHCVLDRPPFPEVQDFKGTVEATVDKTKHVNGGCRGLTSDGLSWQCYLGQEAVRQRIISQDFLGEYAPAPGHG